MNHKEPTKGYAIHIHEKAFWGLTVSDDMVPLTSGKHGC